MQTKEEKAAYKKQYDEDNKEAINARQKQYDEDHKEARKQWREDNKEAIAAKQKALRDARNLEIFEYKGGACKHCSSRELDYLGMYEYHHVDPTTKLHSVSVILTGPLDRLYAEVDKCLLLCPNCHRKEHINLFKAKLNED